jgi:hypothetical protein
MSDLPIPFPSSSSTLLHYECELFALPLAFCSFLFAAFAFTHDLNGSAEEGLNIREDGSDVSGPVGSGIRERDAASAAHTALASRLSTGASLRITGGR